MTLGDEYGTCCPNIDIPDNDPNGLDFDVEVTETGPIGLVQVSSGTINHSRPQDLQVTLISPEGTQVVLFNQVPLGVNTVDFSGKVTERFLRREPQGDLAGACCR